MLKDILSTAWTARVPRDTSDRSAPPVFTGTRYVFSSRSATITGSSMAFLSKFEVRGSKFEEGAIYSEPRTSNLELPVQLPVL
jgi:hypothetical protein